MAAYIYKHDFYNTMGRNALRALQRKNVGRDKSYL